MPIDRTLARVDEEIAAGRLLPARQRLLGLVGSYPQRLDVRERLALVCRRLGDDAQAGRWGYLSPAPPEAEVRAFRRAYPDPVQRMRALRWRGSEHEAATALARERLAAVRAEAQAARSRRVRWDEPADPHDPDDPEDWRDAVAALGCALVVLLVVVLLAVGAWTAVRWVL